MKTILIILAVCLLVSIAKSDELIKVNKVERAVIVNLDEIVKNAAPTPPQIPPTPPTPPQMPPTPPQMP